MRNGYIFLHRKMLDSEVFTYGASVVSVWVYLLLAANWKATIFQGEEVSRGSLVFSQDALGEVLDLSRQQIRTALAKLEKSTMISTKRLTNRRSIITVCNYEKYQALESTEQPRNQPEEQPADNQQITSNQPLHKKLRSKEGKKEGQKTSAPKVADPRVKTLGDSITSLYELAYNVPFPNQGQMRKGIKELLRFKDEPTILSLYSKYLNEQDKFFSGHPWGKFSGWLSSQSKANLPYKRDYKYMNESDEQYAAYLAKFKETHGF